MISRYFRYPDGVWPNLAALTVTLTAYPVGIALLMQQNWLSRVLGLPLLCLSLIWSAYYIHEFAHQAIFKTANANRRLGTLMTWINGSCYASFDSLRRKHMRHHVERADVISFDVQKFLRDSPSWFRKLVLALEWMYFPAVEFIMRAFVIGMPFVSRQPGRARLRMLAILAVRTSAFTALGWYSPWALALYFLAYLIFITVLRFADCFQHTYDAYPIIDDTPVPQDKVRDRIYEQQNTYTNVVGLKSPILNMLWLNFGFHNAHHHKPAMPWHRLPALHRECYDDRFTQVLPARELLRSFHINRVRRVLSADYGRVLGPDEKGRADGFVGAVGVSFLTAA